MRVGIVFVVGVLVGTQANRGIYRLAFHRRNIGPWSKPDAQAPPRTWLDYLPIVGWFALRRESSLHGRGYWVRPMLIELLLGLGLAGLYYWECNQGLIPVEIQQNTWEGNWIKLANVMKGQGQPDVRLHAQFLTHAILIVLMTIASFIDIDERMIPKEITDFGALGGMLLAVLLPIGRFPEWNAFANDPPTATSWTDATLLFTTSPLAWPTWLSSAQGFLLVMLAFAGWWLAIIPTTLSTRHGLPAALRYFSVSLRRRVWPRKHRPREGTPIFFVMLGFGWAIIAVVWLLRGAIGDVHWQALASAVVGMVVGGAIVWAVRIVGSHALKQEAMGFGDVTLVAMIGAFLGWQPCLMLFFIAPFIGVFIALANLIIRRELEIWFGPFLCAAAVVVIVCWATIWEFYGRTLFVVGGGTFIPSVVVLLFPLMWAMLIVWMFIKVRLVLPLFRPKVAARNQAPTRGKSGGKK